VISGLFFGTFLGIIWKHVMPDPSQKKAGSKRQKIVAFGHCEESRRLGYSEAIYIHVRLPRSPGSLAMIAHWTV